MVVPMDYKWLIHNVYGVNSSQKRKIFFLLFEETNELCYLFVRDNY